MAKKNKQASRKSLKKIWRKEIEDKLVDSLKDYHRKVSDRRFNKNLRRAGKILSQVLSGKAVAAVPKKAVKVKKNKQVAEAAPEIKSISQ